MQGLRLGLSLGSVRYQVDLSIGTSTADGEVVVTDLGGGEFSYTVSGSSITAFNGTYTQDLQARTLTGALLESEGVLCLVAPVIAMTNDVDSDTLVEVGDTLGLTQTGLYIYDPDQGVPDAPTHQWQSAGANITDATDPDALLLTIVSLGQDVRLNETFGGVTTASNTIAVEGGSAMAADPAGLMRFKAQASDLTLSTTDVTGWTDIKGSHDLAAATGIGAPQWDSANGLVQFRRATPTGLRSAAAGPIGDAAKLGETIIIFMVIDPVDATEEFQRIFGEARSNSSSNANAFGIDTKSGELDFYVRGASGTGAYGSVFSGVNASNPQLGLGKTLLRYTLTTSSLTIHANGVLKATVSVDGTNLPDSERVFLGAQPDDTGVTTGSANSCTSDVDVFEIYVTTDPAAIPFVESELTTAHGPF